MLVSKLVLQKLCADYESRVPQHLFHIYVLYTFDNISAHREICNMHCTLTTIRFSLLIVRGSLQTSMSKCLNLKHLYKKIHLRPRLRNTVTLTQRKSNLKESSVICCVLFLIKINITALYATDATVS